MKLQLKGGTVTEKRLKLKYSIIINYHYRYYQ